MNYYSDPTASKALGNINREFTRYEKRAKKLRELYEEGKLSSKDLERARSQFKGLYKHVLDNVLTENHE